MTILNSKISQFSKTAGPGILFASAAIGVSHLIQSTRAGADFGLWMLIFVIVVSLLKYPFFEYGSRYANATQTSIIDGYKKLGKPILWMYFIITIASMFFITGTVITSYSIHYTKLYEVEPALTPLVGLLPATTPILLLHNGMGTEAWVHDHFPHNPLLLGITSNGALRLGPGHFRHTGPGETWLGAANPAGEDWQGLAAELAAALPHADWIV